MGSVLDCSKDLRERQEGSPRKAHNCQEKLEKDKNQGVKMAVERTYNVPLRKAWLKVPRYMRTKKAAKALKEFLRKHMKSEDVKIGKYLNEFLWRHGIKNPPHHVKVNVSKDDKGAVKAELVGAPVEKKEEAEKEKKKREKEQKKVAEEEKKGKKEEGKEKKAEEKSAEVKEKPKQENKTEERAKEEAQPKEKPKAEKKEKAKEAPGAKDAKKEN